MLFTSSPGGRGPKFADGPGLGRWHSCGSDQRNPRRSRRSTAHHRGTRCTTSSRARSSSMIGTPERTEAIFPFTESETRLYRVALRRPVAN